MDFLNQLGMLLRMNLLGVPQRLGLACTTVIGVTCAVGVLISMLAMNVGARRAAMGNVRPDRASVLNLDAVEPDRSDIPKDLAAMIADLPGIRRDSRGQPMAVPEVAVYVQARRKDSGNSVGFPMIGAGAGLAGYAPELHLSAGRMFRPGLRELIASNYCAHRYQNFSVGSKRLIGRRRRMARRGELRPRAHDRQLRRVRGCGHGSLRLQAQQLQRRQGHAAIPGSF
jgi:putative ABC transport system permease protein